MWQITIEESPEGAPEQNYYQEHRGPILQVRGRRADLQLSFVPNEDDDIFDDEKFVSETLEPFCATTKGKDRRHITLKNEGTTVIRYQWLTFPPNTETEFLLANPAGSVLPGGYMNAVKGLGKKKRLNDEKVFKPPSLEFRYRKLPGVLPPGQSLEFPIIFRSTKPGYFYETLYLLTHPKLTDTEGRGYCARLTGICMDPDLLDSESGSNLRPENIKQFFKQTTLEQQGKDLIDSILDNALFIETEHPSTLPYMRVTSESIFYTHNTSLKYHYKVSQQALDTVRRLVEYVVPKERIEHNEKLCPLSIESLYRLLWKRNSSKDLYWTHFKTDKTENMLKQLADYSSIMIQPRRFLYPVASSRKITASTATFLTLIDEICMAMDHIDQMYNTDELTAVLTEMANKKLETGRLYDKEGASEWDFTTIFLQVGDIALNDNVSEIGSATTIGDQELVKPESSKSIPGVAKEKKGKRGRSIKKWNKKTTPDLEDSAEDANFSAEEDDQNSVASSVQETGHETDVGEDSFKAIQLIQSGKMAQDQIKEEKKRRIYQAKKMVFEELLADGIERIICAVDAFNSMEDYRPSEFMTKPSSSNYCCAD